MDLDHVRREPSTEIAVGQGLDLLGGVAEDQALLRPASRNAMVALSSEGTIR
jgi:hypothetical protein